jgi:4-hydroxy-4-methyl-2-oxoglutarate aldolase
MSTSAPYDNGPFPSPFKNADVCDISDACDQLDVGAVRTGAIKPVYRDCAPIVGIISTVKLTTGSGAPFGPLVEAFTGEAFAGADVVLVDLGGRTDVQCWGTVLATAARLSGVRAAVVNGAVRDASDLAELRFPTYALGVHPAGMRGRLVFTGAGEDVLIERRPVSAGWAVAADPNGVIFFPAGHADRVLELAQEIAARERDMLARVRAADGVAAALDLLTNPTHTDRR